METATTCCSSLAAYAVTLVLLLAEVWLLVRRSRTHAAIASQEPDDEA